MSFFTQPLKFINPKPKNSEVEISRLESNKLNKRKQKNSKLKIIKLKIIKLKIANSLLKNHFILSGTIGLSLGLMVLLIIFLVLNTGILSSFVKSSYLGSFKDLYLGSSGQSPNNSLLESESKSGLESGSESGSQPEKPEPPVYTVAILGYGGAGHDGGALTDTIIVVKVDTKTKQIALISVPRDSWVGLPTSGWSEPLDYWKINAAYAIGIDDRNYSRKPAEFTQEAGGGSMARYALEQVVGFNVDHFVAVDFSGFKQAIDVLGGVLVKVEKPLIDPYYPVMGLENETCGKSLEEVEQLTATMSGDLLLHEFTCRFKTLNFDTGTQKMDGETALEFVRSRHASVDGGDFNRSKRQRAVLLAVKDKVFAIDFLPKLLPFIQKISSHVRTDLTPSFIAQMIDQKDTFITYQIVSVPLTTDAENILKISTSFNGQSIVVPKTASDSAIRANSIDWKPVWEYLDLQLASESATLLEKSQ
jgi:LCP family protein required for cell wall assembly